MSNSNRLKFEPLVNFDASTLTGTYQAVNGSGFIDPLNIIKIYNSSTSLVLLSTDGATDEDFVPPGGTFIIDVEANADDNGQGVGHWSVPKGTVIYAKTSSNTDRLIIAGYHN